MPDVTIDVDVYCARCGNVLQTESKEGYCGTKEFHAEPCEKCLDAAKDKGDDEGYDRGLKNDCIFRALRDAEDE